MSQPEQWGPWKPHDPFSAMGPPPDAPPGTVIQADHRIRPDRVGSCNRPFYVTGHVLTVRTGECFALNPVGQSQPVTTSHLVTRYRVQKDGAPSEDLQEFTAEEEEVMRLLEEALAEQGAGASATMVNIKGRFDLDWPEADEIADAAAQHHTGQSKTRRHP